MVTKVKDPAGVVRRTPVSTAQRESAARWDRVNMTTVGCKVTRAKALEFKRACMILGTKPNQVFLKAIDEIIKAAQ